jgi:alpha-L-glutamate ligase-like protein
MFSAHREAGLLGMNRRNASYILSYNPRKYYPLVDDKLKTKEILEMHHLPTPELYFSISGNYELKAIREIKFLKEFVVKPARGAEGRGIWVLVDRQERKWRKASGEWVSPEDLEFHTSNILAGLYSLGGTDDRAFMEYCVHSHQSLKPLAYQGVPDIRVILYHGIPLMCMLRLPTKESDGKANLHQGAVGAGVEMLKGITLGGVHRDHLVDIHPDTKNQIAGFKIPFWKDILQIACKLHDVFKLGYIGVDFVVDHLLGPMILELNARPGLNIQSANREGLLTRLNKMDVLLQKKQMEKMTWEHRLEISQEMLIV